MEENNNNPGDNNKSKVIKPKHIIKKNPLDLERSKSAPIETKEEDTENNDYISSYNYYIYYTSIEPKDPRLPKPTYRPKPNMEFIREGLNKVDEREEDDEELPKEKGIEKLTNDINTLNLNDNNKIDNIINNEPKNLDFNFQGNKLNMNQNNIDTINNPLNMGYYTNFSLNQRNNFDNSPAPNASFFPSSGYYNGLSNNNFMPQQNLMINNYYNESRFQMMPNFTNMNVMMPNQMNQYPMAAYMNIPNMPNINNLNTKNFQKKNKKLENLAKKEMNEQQNTDEVIEKAVQYSKDHSGSRLVQQTYEGGNETIRTKIFEKIKPEILNLSKDIFGNYAIQKILESKDENKNNYIMESLKGNIYDLSTHMYGCRVMQQLITVINEKYLPMITSELKEHFEQLIEDQNGNHVMQKLIERSKLGENNGIYDIVYANISKLSKHQYGCRVIQTLLKKCSKQQIKNLLEKIYKNVFDLSEDQYGNYIIQYILENQMDIDVSPIYNGLKEHIYEFSLHKYASNVVEKALHCGNKEQRKNIINEIIKQDDKTKECLLSMVKDKFGNYVVQQILEYSDESTRENIISRINSLQSLGKKNGFSKHVMNCIDKLRSSNGNNNNNIGKNQKKNSENDKKVKSKK
jgi:pumilio RNA-binding family